MTVPTAPLPALHGGFMSYGTDPAPNGDQAPYGDPNQFGPMSLAPDVAPLPRARLGEAVKRFFQRYAQFSGYASQSEFWWPFLLFQIVIPSAFYTIIVIIMIPESFVHSGKTPPALIITCGAFLFYIIAMIIPALAVTARRLHDTGKSELFLLFYFIGLGIVPLIMCCMRSRPDLYRPEWG